MSSTKAHEAINDITNKHVVCVVLLRWLSLEISLNQILEACPGKHHILDRRMDLAFHSKCIVEGIAQHCQSSRSSTILTGKSLCFAQFSIGMAAWLRLTFLVCLHNLLSFIHSIVVY